MSTSTSERFLATAKSAGLTLYNHKVKVILFLVLCYGLKKAYDFYRFVKPLLDLKNQLTQGGPALNGAPRVQPELTASQKALAELND